MSDRNLSFHLSTTTPGVSIKVSVTYFSRDGYYVNMYKCTHGNGYETVHMDVGGPFRAVCHERAARFSRKKLEAAFQSVRFEVCTGHTEDRYVKQALGVAEYKGLVIDYWSKAIAARKEAPCLSA